MPIKRIGFITYCNLTVSIITKGAGNWQIKNKYVIVKLYVISALFKIPIKANYLKK